MNTKTKRIIISALMTSLVCVATMLIKIPSPMKGYVNVGDCIVLLCGWMLSPVYAFVSAGLGSALADVFSGYLVYAPATFVIKGLMALVAFAFCKILAKKSGKLLSQIIGGLVAEILMVALYYVFEGFLYGFVPSLVNIPANAVQGVVGLVIGSVLIKILDKLKVSVE